MNTTELRHRVRTRFRGRTTPSGFPERVVLSEVPVSQLETMAERYGIDVDQVPDYITPDGAERWRKQWTRPAGVRRIDLLAVGLWRSTGHHVHGVELKVSRGDWLKELRQPQKAEAAILACDFWWLAVGDSTIVRDGELPPGWGLLVPSGRGMRAKVQPDQRTDPVRSPSWVASVVIAAATQHGVCQGIAKVDAYWQGYQDGRRSGW